MTESSPTRPKQVLVLALHFPPIGGGGVQRVAKIVRYLPDFGYRPTVVTGPGRSQDVWAPADETLEADIPPDVDVVRIPGTEPRPSSGWRRRAERLLDLPSTIDRWWLEQAFEVGRRVGAGTDVIFGELVPYRTADPARRLARALGVPWVADLQDPWALDEMWLYPSAAHRLADRGRMRRALRSAAAVIMNTPEAVARVTRAFPELREERVVSIPNGFDEADFRGPAPGRRDGKFRVVHSGYLYTTFGLEHRARGRVRRLLGGMPVPEVDFLTRSHVYLLEAVDRLLAADPSLRSVLEVHLVGALTDADREVASRSPVVHLHGYVDHASTIEHVVGADLLFLPMQDLPAGMRAGLVPGKTYEYLRAGRPILAAVPDGDARELLGEAGNALVCRPADVEGMAQAIAGAVERWRAGAEPARPDPGVVARYERRRQTEELARILDEVLAG